MCCEKFSNRAIGTMTIPYRARPCGFQLVVAGRSWRCGVTLIEVTFRLSLVWRISIVQSFSTDDNQLRCRLHAIERAK
jgi:hypothetical protein